MENAATISELYGVDYHDDAVKKRVDKVCDVIASNISSLNFVVRYDFSPIFHKGNVDGEILDSIVSKIKKLNKNLLVQPLTSVQERQMLPYLLKIQAVYFRIFDLERKRIYLVYISPENMEAY